MQENVSGAYPTVGRIVHVEQPTDPVVCLVGIVTGTEFKPATVYLRVLDRNGLAEWPDSVLMDSSDRARIHNPKHCPRLTEQPAPREA